MQIDIIGVPIDLGAGRRGVDMGPSALRYANLRKKLEALGLVVQDQGNIEVPIAETCSVTDPKLKYVDCIVPMARRVAGAVATAIQGGRFPLVLGGDHSLSLGSIRGAAKAKKIGVIWVDAHADFNTPETTPSGNIHGMPLAALAGLGAESLVKLWDEATPVVDPKKIAILGARDLDPGEKDNLRKAGVMVMSMEQIDRFGMTAAIEQSIERVGAGTDGIYLSFDMDALDPQAAPGVGTRVAAGLTQREAHLVCELIAETGKLAGMDLVEVNPILDVQNQTAELGVDLILFGARQAHLDGGLIMQPTLEWIEGVARGAGAILRAGYNTEHEVVYKGVIDLVTETDRQSEEYLLREIQGRFSDHHILTEETGEIKGRDESVWYIDPLDGTVNYAHHIPIFCVSIGFESHGVLELGAVYDPLRDEMFSAQRGRGANLNGKPIHASDATDLQRSLLVTGFPYDAWNTAQDNFDNFVRLAKLTRGVRRLGSAALDACYVAAGRFDGFWELSLKPWDVAAAGLIALEAGALVTNVDGGPDFLAAPQSVVAAGPGIHGKLLEALRKS